jgi:small-conductance mechanosensitive channel
MSELVEVFAGWWGYATRWPVILQVLVIFGPAILFLAIRKAFPQARILKRRTELSVVFPLIAVVAMALFGAPTGLAIFLGLICLFWLVIDWLRHWLEGRIDSDLLSKIDTEIARPLLLIATSFALVSKVSNINQLAVIPLFEWFGSALTIGQVITALVALYLFIVGSLPLSVLLAVVLGRLLSLSEGGRRALTLILRYIIVGVGIVWALDFTGLNRTAILAIAGGLSVGLGFGVKEVFANFISGIWLLLEGSVRPGEVLYVDNDPCEVRKLGLRAALLWRERDNAELLIPNQTFLTMTTTTFTGSDAMRRCQVEVAVAYDHSPISVMPLLIQAAEDVTEVLAEPAPVPLILDYGDSTIKYAVRFWIATPMKGTRISSNVRLSIWHQFQQNEIELPLPQLVLHGDLTDD